MALHFATKCCYYYLLHVPELRFYSACKGLIQMLEKDLIKITNPKHFRILSDIQAIVFYEVAYIPGSANMLADALSRLCRHLRIEGNEMENIKPRILGLSTCRARRTRQLRQQDPLVENLVQIGSLDQEYLGLMSLVENRTLPRDLPAD